MNAEERQKITQLLNQSKSMMRNIAQLLILGSGMGYNEVMTRRKACYGHAERKEEERVLLQLWIMLQSLETMSHDFIG